MKRANLLCILGISLSCFIVFPASSSAFGAPQLLWKYGGCYNSWCETGWYSSPAVADLFGNGTQQVIASAYSIVNLDGATGALNWSVASGHDRSESGVDNVGRTWPNVVVKDVDKDGQLEIISAHSGGYVSVYDRNGYFKSGWPQRPTTNELRGMAVADLDGNGDMEIVVTAAIGSKTNTWVYEHTGAVRPGWPQLSGDNGYAWGVYNNNASVGDIDGDGAAEIIVPSDVFYICAYNPDGSKVQANAMYGDKVWGKVGVWESMTPELRGWGACDGVRAESYRANFADGASVIADVNQDGIAEIVAVGNMADCHTGYPPSKYNAVYIFNADRSRFKDTAHGFNWETIPVDTGAPLSEDYNVIESVEPNPVVVDLDNDGFKEILYSSYDGRVHAFWLDKTEHHNWPYSVYNPAEGFYRFASEPVVADLDNDGSPEVIFTSWPASTASAPLRLGKLHILSAQGTPLHEVDLPAPKSSSLYWNGALAAPTLANIDGDPNLEIVVNTVYAGVVAYRVPDSANARILWQSGRNGQVYLRKDNPALSVLIAGSGGGRVTSTPSGIDCSTGFCSDTFPRETAVSLAATPDSDSLFAGWNSICSGSGSCGITIHDDIGVTATFNYVQPARTSSTSYFNTLSAAYAILPDSTGGTIQARQFTFVESPILNRSIPIVLRGGFNPAYTSSTGYTSIQGDLTVELGSLTADRVVIR
ncbi:MAG: VCBS repeat-containing protein [Desulfuromonadales bacterium]|nr:VCBS repeat-containing protein [Desulfuromonadales bacterium]